MEKRGILSGAILLILSVLLVTVLSSGVNAQTAEGQLIDTAKGGCFGPECAGQGSINVSGPGALEESIKLDAIARLQTLKNKECNNALKEDFLKYAYIEKDLESEYNVSLSQPEQLILSECYRGIKSGTFLSNQPATIASFPPRGEALKFPSSARIDYSEGKLTVEALGKFYYGTHPFTLSAGDRVVIEKSKTTLFSAKDDYKFKMMQLFGWFESKLGRRFEKIIPYDLVLYAPPTQITSSGETNVANQPGKGIELTNPPSEANTGASPSEQPKPTQQTREACIQGLLKEGISPELAASQCN